MAGGKGITMTWTDNRYLRGRLVAYRGRVAMITGLTQDGTHCHLTFTDDGIRPHVVWNVPIKAVA